MIQHYKVGAVSNLPFSSAVEANGLVFVSGQASVDPVSGAIIADTFEGEMRRSFGNLQRVLDSLGCNIADIVSLRCYVDRQARLEEYNRIYREILSAPFPARTTLIGVLGQEFLKFEVDAIAYRR
jgi:2-iminobutanoate/2-iminopropanoate deaminase